MRRISLDDPAVQKLAGALSEVLQACVELAEPPQSPPSLQLPALDQLPMLLRPKQAARVFGLGRDHFYRLLEQGQIPSINIDGQRMVPTQWLEEWVEQRRGGN